MPNRLIVVEIVLLLQRFERFIEHLGLFQNVTVPIMIILKADDNDRFIITRPNLAIVFDFPVIKYFDL